VLPFYVSECSLGLLTACYLVTILC